MDNVRFHYFYRDGSNFKKWSSVVFADPDHTEIAALKDTLETSFETDGLFIAHQIRIPEAFLYGPSDANADDHCYHEFFSVDRTSDPPTDIYNRSIRQFAAEVEHQARRGWMPFDPFERWLQER